MWREHGVRQHERGDRARDVVKIEWFVTTCWHPACSAARIVEVEQNQDWLALASKPNRFVAVGGLNNSKAKLGEQVPHDRLYIGRIIGDQDGGA